MIKLDELIDKYCPNGVEFKPLCEVTNLTAGDRIIKSMMQENMKYPVYGGGVYPTGKYNYFNFENSITISRAGSAGFVNWVEGKFWATDVCFVASQKNEMYNIKYIYYYVKNKQHELQRKIYGGNLPKLNKDYLWKLPIALPPLDVQYEIVSILDDFTLLEEELETELKAELEVRQKQFSYYREQLINLDCKKVQLSQLVDIYLGLTYTPKYVEEGVKFISAQNTSKDYLDLENVKYISRKEFDKITSNAKPKRGDILFTRVGSNLGHPVIVDTDEELCMFVSLGYLRVKDSSRVLNSYIKHWINTEAFWSQVRKNVHGSAKVNLNTGWLSKFEVAIPSYDKQVEIAEKLDEFERICNDLSEGLSTEIGARQKQYEYYRDKLLNFKELKVEN